MSNLEIDRVLAQIRSISSATRAGAAGPAAGAAGKVAGADNGFAKLLKQGIDSVNSTQLKANDVANKFERGVPGVELPQVMLEMQKANVSFRALTEVRNKFVEAYREIMNMPL
ncbi:MAG TPA: flagellar hook-basal body complex protein FliE [Steroidobacteraceae bacterium]|nr:flagellar hook-basal body complex protein FliE [Steroidobacteraceae bacterium]